MPVTKKKRVAASPKIVALPKIETRTVEDDIVSHVAAIAGEWRTIEHIAQRERELLTKK